LDERIAKGAGLVVELAAAEALAAGGAEAARAALIVATAEREAAIAADHAAALARHLVAGEPCPVCEQPVAVVPPGSPAPDLDAAEAALHRAGADATAADGALRAAAEKHAQSVALLSQVGAEREVALADVTWADAAEVASALGAVTAAEAALTSARSAERERRAAARTATKARDEAMAREAEARDGFDRARDPVAALGAPAPVRVDLAADWLALDSWARTRAGEEESARAAAASRQAAAQGALDRATASLMAACREAGVTTPGVRIGEDVAAARSAAAARAESLRAAAAEAEAVRAEVAAAESEAQVARSLAQHLNASHFEKWLLDEALALLVEGATRVLGELSGGAYALTLDGSGAFAVVDHRNGDQVRSARTLSGGETFLASLALALALADRLSELAAGGAARLESVFLDEGFGSLDADTLDTVAAAMEALASGGRVVGLVTHVRELADRVPTRFEVTKGPRTSAVVRVEA
jgi:exonuclease SbcC